jgi:hypothetical protein
MGYMGDVARHRSVRRHRRLSSFSWFNLLTHLTLLTTYANVSPAFAADESIPLPQGYKLLYEQRFDRPAAALQEFVMTDPSAWRISKTDQQSALELVTQSRYQPPVRSPVNIALIADKAFGDFVLEADLTQTGREYGHRDMCLFFGVQSPTNFYYAHIATAADPNAHNVFIVNGKPRTNIARHTTGGVKWGSGVAHKVRLERNAATGSIKVFFDDLSEPIMMAEDKTFASGFVGFGSFDDTGLVDNVRIWGPSVEARKTEFFRRPPSKGEE